MFQEILQVGGGESVEPIDITSENPFYGEMSKNNTTTKTIKQKPRYIIYECTEKSSHYTTVVIFYDVEKGIAIGTKMNTLEKKVDNFAPTYFISNLTDTSITIKAMYSGYVTCKWIY